MTSVADEAVELTRELVALDTVNPALVPGAPGERPAVDLLVSRLEPRGFEIEIVGPPDRPSLIATHRGGGGRSLALNGHLDTVGVEGMVAAAPGLLVRPVRSPIVLGAWVREYSLR